MSKIYTVNGPSSSSSLPDWLTLKRQSKRRTRVQSTLSLIQDFTFPEASIRVKTSQDGHFALATGTYKPQIKVFDLDQLSQKFERHTDAENIDFLILSDDYTKSVHLQADRSIELHTQSGLHHRTRIPRFGRALAYHPPSCDALFAAEGPDVYRLNLDQGRFLAPFTLPHSSDLEGVNVLDVNPAHHLLAFGTEPHHGTTPGTVHFWDPRSRTPVAVLHLPTSRLLPLPSSITPTPHPAATGILPPPRALAVTALASHTDGLSYAVGTSSGHTLLYDIRARTPYALKDQGYGLPVRAIAWLGARGPATPAADGKGLLMTADKKVLKIWDGSNPRTNFASLTPSSDINHVHHVPNSGLLLAAHEGIDMGAYFIPALGPAPRWAAFLENVTEELEEDVQTTGAPKGIYEDYKFVEKGELQSLNLTHLIGTPTLKPYMHGYFLSLKLYDAARVIANPYVHAEHRERVLRERRERLAEGRIRARGENGSRGGVGAGAGVKVKVNQALAERVVRDGERERKRVARKAAKGGEGVGPDAMDVDVDIGAAENEPDHHEDDHGEEDEHGEDEHEETKSPTNKKKTLLTDPRFSKLFEDPEFAVDESSREYALLNPSAVAAQRSRVGADVGAGAGREARRARTAVEEEEEESDKVSSDGLGGSDDDRDNSDSGGDSSDEGILTKYDPRTHPGQKNVRAQEAYVRTRERNRVAGAGAGAGSGANATRAGRQPNVPLVPLRTGTGARRSGGGDATFGQRRGEGGGRRSEQSASASVGRLQRDEDGEGGMEISWVPRGGGGGGGGEEDEVIGKRSGKGKVGERRKGVEEFGVGMERGGGEEQGVGGAEGGGESESARKGRTTRRVGVRSGSKNTFRRL